VYSELAKITHSDIAASEKMAEWLAEKLKKPEPSIKWKVNRCAGAVDCIDGAAEHARLDMPSA
jgi:hypothetical protein